MLRSLVGSEMCIRDSTLNSRLVTLVRPNSFRKKADSAFGQLIGQVEELEIDTSRAQQSTGASQSKDFGSRVYFPWHGLEIKIFSQYSKHEESFRQDMLYSISSIPSISISSIASGDTMSSSSEDSASSSKSGMNGTAAGDTMG
eukprot:TRINITY_DN437_c0_g1_i2.p1 TRINITY_DN437_c0_g1~~TRINITY_DN437_c0_g1_i2.p1  ORF type:complete len:161 (-),score=48.62 TRINITY_DN437_c0_g1_i2:1049-1480(-)